LQVANWAVNASVTDSNSHVIGGIVQHDVVDELRRKLPPIFLGAKVGDLTGHSINWGTIQNRRARRVIPGDERIFVRSGNRVLVYRDPFLDWWSTTLEPARRAPVLPRKSRRQRNSDAAA
jgi:hypothetical protein